MIGTGMDLNAVQVSVENNFFSMHPFRLKSEESISMVVGTKVISGYICDIYKVSLYLPAQKQFYRY